MKSMNSLLLGGASILAALTFATTVSASEPTPAPTADEAPPAAFDAKAAWEGTCAKCHGPDGKGQTKIGDKVRGEGKPMPDLSTKADQSKFESIIANGVPDTLMKGYANKFKPEELKALTDFAKALKK